MDELKLKSKMLRGVISKLVSTTIQKKCGYNTNIQLNDLNIVIDDKAHLHLDVDLEMDCQELMKIVKSIGLD